MTKWEDLEASAMYAMLGSQEAMTGFEGAMEQINKIHFDSFGSAIQGIGRILFMDLVYPIGQKVLPHLNTFANYLSDNLPGAIATAKSTFQSMAPTLLGIGGAALAFKGALMAVTAYQKTFNAIQGISATLLRAHRTAMLAATFAGGGFKGMLAGLRSGMGALNLTLLANPIVAVVAGLVALGAGFVLLYKKSETFRTAIDPLLAVLKTELMTALSGIKSAFLAIVPVVMDIASSIFPMLVSVVQMVIPMIISIIQTGVPIIVTVLQTIATIVSTVIIPAIGTILSVIQQVFPQVQLIIQTALAIVTGVIQTAMMLLQGNWSGAWEMIKSTAVTIMNNIVSFFTGINLFEVGKTIITGLINGIKSMGKAVLGAITSMIPKPIRAAASGIMDSLGLGGYAKGGIVTSPEIAWIGEGGDTEAVIPWNNSQRSKDLWMATGDALGMWDTNTPESNPFDFDSPDYPFGGGGSGGSGDGGTVIHVTDNRQVIIQGNPDQGQVEREMDKSNKSLLDQLDEEYRNKKRGEFN